MFLPQLTGGWRESKRESEGKAWPTRLMRKRSFFNELYCNLNLLYIFRSSRHSPHEEEGAVLTFLWIESSRRWIEQYKWLGAFTLSLSGLYAPKHAVMSLNRGWHWGRGGNYQAMRVRFQNRERVKDTNNIPSVVTWTRLWKHQNDLRESVLVTILVLF